MATQQHSAGEPPSEKDHKLLNGCVPLSHQVAGHMYGKDKVGILQHPDGTVLKQLQPPPRGPRELDFYNMVSVSQDRLWGGGKPEDCPGQPPFHVPPVFQAEIALTHRCIQCLTFHMVITVFSSDCTDPKLRDLQIFLPKYFGTWAPPGSTNDLYLKLEDVTRKFDKPCIMDVKIGQKSYDPHASAEKIQQQISKYPLMEEIGFLVLGMRIYHMDSDSFETQNQHYGRRLTKDTIKPGLSKFFHNGCYLRKDAVSACLHKVQHILQWFEDQDTLHFYASSLLFVYDGSCPQSAVDGRVHEKKVCTTELLTEDEVTECNNNISIMSSMENGKNEELAGKKRCKIYAVHKKTCPKRLHSEAFLEGEDTTPQNPVPQEHLNGNLLTKLESVLCQVSADTRDSAQVDVRMIDFAHVFPSDGQDLGYIYGLKNLISVLQSILNE